jgi:GNAT superfamily N-acetyltransferase
MVEADIPAVTAISDVVHGRYTEQREVFAERLALYPAGCLMLDHDGAAEGYLISHPWHRRSPVPLDQFIGAIPKEADGYYLHDLALLPDTRGLGAGRKGVELVLRQAADAGFDEVSLVAVNGADAFWSAQGFSYVDDDAVARKLEIYGEGTFFMERRV